MPDPREFVGHFAHIAGRSLLSFSATVAVFLGAGLALGGVSFYFLREYPVWAGVAWVVAIVEALAFGVFLGGKRALVLGVARALGRFRLGGYFVGQIFDRLHLEQQSWLTRNLESLPLAQAETWLTTTVSSLTRAPLEGGGPFGFLRRLLRNRLLDAIHKFTLARFREEGTTQGGINLTKVRQELEGSIDQLLVNKVRRGMWLWILAAGLGLPLLVALQTWGLTWWLGEG